MPSRRRAKGGPTRPPPARSIWSSPTSPIWNADGDPVCSDCAPLDPGRAVPVETIDLSIGPDEATVSWSSVPSAATYDLDRGLIAGAFVYDHACLGSGLAAPLFEDAEIPPLGQAFYYVARANNACGAGILGIASRGSTLAKATCSAVEGS
jgi:hypothetical protein